jgi:hypothetical protein
MFSHFWTSEKAEAVSLQWNQVQVHRDRNVYLEPRLRSFGTMHPEASRGTAQGFHRPFSSRTALAPPWEIAGTMSGLQVSPTVVSVNAPKAASTSTVDRASCMKRLWLSRSVKSVQYEATGLSLDLTPQSVKQQVRLAWQIDGALIRDSMAKRGKILLALCKG